jgi:hypothetical protein
VKERKMGKQDGKVNIFKKEKISCFIYRILLQFNCRIIFKATLLKGGFYEKYKEVVIRHTIINDNSVNNANLFCDGVGEGAGAYTAVCG